MERDAQPVGRRTRHCPVPAPARPTQVQGGTWGETGQRSPAPLEGPLGWFQHVARLVSPLQQAPYLSPAAPSTVPSHCRTLQSLFPSEPEPGRSMQYQLQTGNPALCNAGFPGKPQPTLRDYSKVLVGSKLTQLFLTYVRQNIATEPPRKGNYGRMFLLPQTGWG